MFQLLYQLLYPQTYKILPIAKELGYVHHSKALQERFERQKLNWRPHHEKCRDIYDSFFASVPMARKIVILGSSHLHEYPQELLLSRFEKITLMDVVHPPQIVQWARKHKDQVDLICFDVSLLLDKIPSLSSYEELISVSQTPLQTRLEADLIVSANLLSQLHLTAMDLVEKKDSRSWSLPEKDNLATTTAQAHLNWLKSLNVPTLIYSDREVIYRNIKNEITYSGSYALDFTGFDLRDTWTWNLAPMNEISPLYSVEMTMKAYTFTPTKRPS